MYIKSGILIVAITALAVGGHSASTHWTIESPRGNSDSSHSATTPPYVGDGIPVDLDTSNPYLILTDAFRIVGYTKEAATSMVKEIGPQMFDPEHGVPLDWKTSNKHAALAEAFDRAGFQHQVAADLATIAMHAFSGAEPDGLGTAVPTTTPPYVGDGVPVDFNTSNPYLILTDAFEIVGFTREAATSMVKEIGPQMFDPENGVPLDWKTSNKHAVLAEAFGRAGFEHQVAADLATIAMHAFSGAEPGGGGAAAGDECHVYTIAIVWCGPQGQKRRTREYIPSNCWEDLLQTCGLTNVTCSVGDFLVYELELNPGCIDGVSGCVWIEKTAPPSWVDCDFGILDCNCFTSCQNSGYRCCPNGQICSGCPCDE